jgi:hypothetical protein
LRSRWRSALLGVVLALGASCDPPLRGTVLSVVPRAQSKLIIMPAYEPDQNGGIQYLHDHIDAIETGPFDGTLVDVGVEGTSLASKARTRAEFEPLVQLLRTTAFKRMTENFQMLKANWGGTDPFDDVSFATIVANAGVIAQVASDAGLRGLFFDVEQQTGDVWAFPRASDTHTFADYEAKAFQRGGEFMAAIAAAAPETTILMNVATTEVFRAVCIAGGALEQDEYRLLPAFIDGMHAARDQARVPALIVDGFDSAWGTRDPRAFPVFEALIHGDWPTAETRWTTDIVSYRNPVGKIAWPTAPAIACSSTVQQKLTRNMPAGVGLKLDFEDTFQTAPAMFSQNYYLPDALQTVLSAAMQSTDHFVWMRSISIDWFGEAGGPAPPEAYLDAIVSARASAP